MVGGPLNEQKFQVEDIVREFMATLPTEDMPSEALEKTPGRYRAALEEMTAGYVVDPKAILDAVFQADCDEMIIVRSLPFWSLCEHHLLPFFGSATVGYIPSSGRVVGLSKIARLVECFSRRLQMQERMTRQIGEALCEHLAPIGVGVLVWGRHMCMETRGVKTSAETVTSFMKGKMRDDDKVRAEFLRLAR